MWSIDAEGNQFKRGYKRLSAELQGKTNEAIIDLAASQHSWKKGDHKKGPPLHCLHTYELGRQYRVLYDVKFEQNLLVLLRVGTHKIY